MLWYLFYKPDIEAAQVSMIQAMEALRFNLLHARVFRTVPNRPVRDIPNYIGFWPVRCGLEKQSGMPDSPKTLESDRFKIVRYGTHRFSPVYIGSV